MTRTRDPEDEMLANMKTRTLLLLGTLLAGCASMGPTLVSGSRTDYNMVLRQADDQQMLLNLVRMRYRDRAMFLELSALNTQFTITSEVNASTELDQGGGLYNLGGTVAIEETPTVSYTPLQGGDFVQRVLTPVTLETLFLLDTSGWSSERLLRLLVNEMNTVMNAAGADGPTPDRAPAHETFRDMAHQLRLLELDNLVEGAMYQGQPVLSFAPAARERPEYLEFTRILGLDPDKRIYPVTSAARGGSADGINLRLRSFAGVMYFLSQSVEVPEADVAAGRVTVTRDAASQPFDWQRVTDGLLTIHSSQAQPENAAVAIHYRGHWFYIDDSDLDSKSTFSLLGQVFQLQSGNAKGAVPVLTIPVGN